MSWKNIPNVLECPGYILEIVFQKRVATLAYDLEHFLPHFDFNVLDILISLYCFCGSKKNYRIFETMKLDDDSIVNSTIPRFFLANIDLIKKISISCEKFFSFSVIFSHSFHTFHK